MARRSLVRGTTGWAISIAIGLVVGSRPARGRPRRGGLAARRGAEHDGARHPRPDPRRRGSALDARSARRSWAPASRGSSGRSSSISIFLTGAYGAVAETLLLLVFGAIVLLAAPAALRARPPRRRPRAPADACTRRARPPYASSVFTLAALVFLSIEAGFDFVLGAFAGGLVVGLALSTAGRSSRADAAGGRRLRLPDPDLLRRHGNELRPRQPADADRPRPRGALPRALRRRPRHAVAALAPRSWAAADTQPRPLRRHRPAADRRDRRDRHRTRRDRPRRRHVADRCGDDLRARPAAARHRDRASGIIPPG